MGVFERLFGRSGPSAVMTITPQTIAVSPVPYLDTTAALGLSAVWRCVTLIADAIADMPWTEWRDDELLPSSRLVRRPLASRTRRWWTWRVVATEALWNCCYCLHVGGSDSAGMPWSLLPLPPNLIQPVVTDPYGLTFPSLYNVAGQQISVEYLTLIERAPFPGTNGYSLQGLLDIARRQFTAYVAADVHMARYWANGGPTTTVITTDQELDTPTADAIAQRWLDRRAMGADHPAVLGKGAEAKPWGADPTTDSATEARREINADIGRYFGVPTRILNAPAGDSETYSNVENDAIDLLRYTLRGYMGPIEDAISDLLPGDYLAGRRMQLDPARFIQGSLVDRANAYKALTADQAVLTIDEARRLGFGLPATTVPQPAAPATPGVSVTQEAVPAGG